MHLTLLPNPSHLEAVAPLVLGKARAKADLMGDEQCSRVLPVILHGDAAFAGQGIVYETMQVRVSLFVLFIFVILLFVAFYLVVLR